MAMLELQILWLSCRASVQELTEDGMGTAQWFHGDKKPFSQKTGTVLSDGRGVSVTTRLSSMVVPAMVTGGEACADRACCWEAYK